MAERTSLALSCSKTASAVAGLHRVHAGEQVQIRLTKTPSSPMGATGGESVLAAPHVVDGTAARRGVNDASTFGFGYVLPPLMILCALPQSLRAICRFVALPLLLVPGNRTRVSVREGRRTARRTPSRAFPHLSLRRQSRTFSPLPAFDLKCCSMLLRCGVSFSHGRVLFFVPSDASASSEASPPLAAAFHPIQFECAPSQRNRFRP